MNYVFFDTECANCKNGNGKICSFGYVKCDESFNIIKKKDILINPESPFMLGNAKNGDGIKLAYPLFKFRNSHTFPYYYEEIKSLLENKDNVIFGFSLSQDINFLQYTCSRYSKKQIEYHAFDIQLLDKKYFNLKNIEGLDTLIERYNLKSYTYHRSDDDALMSMEVYKKLLEIMNLTTNEVFVKYSDCIISVDEIIKANIVRKEKKKQKEILNRLFSNLCINPYANINIELLDDFFNGKKVVFERKLFNDKTKEILDIKNQIYQKGGRIVESYFDADYIVIETNSSYQLQDNQRFVLYKNFIKKFK